MKRIRYCRTNNLKQIFLAFGFIYFFLRFIVMIEISLFKIKGYYENLNMPLTILLYAIILAAIIFIMICFRKFYTLYDDNTITYYNKVFHREKSFDFDKAKLAVFGSRGVSFYASDDGKKQGEEPLFFVPFFRGGIIDAIEINDLFKALKDREGMRVIKEFTVLPGYGKPWYIVKIIYGFLAVIAMVQCATPLALVIVLFKNH